MNNIKINKVFSTDSIPIVFATDENFVPYLYVALQSLVENSSVNNNYEIVILYTNIDEYKRNQFKELEKENVSIRFFDMSEIMEHYSGSWYTHWHYTEAMYYRFLIPEMFQDYDKVLYLDGDIVINCDIADLYNIDLENNQIGATVGLARQHKNDPQRKYIEETLKIKKEKYFNSGVMVFDINKIDKTNFFDKCVSKLNELKTPAFPDQDVLNLIFEDKVKYIHPTYNFTWNMIHIYKESEINLSKEFVTDFIEAKTSPKILHFAGGKKPWKTPNLIYSDSFWKYARKTPFYEEIIYNNTKTKFNKDIIYNAIYRKRIYFKYLRCKFLKSFTWGSLKEHYTNKSNSLKTRIKDYRTTLKK